MPDKRSAIPGYVKNAAKVLCINLAVLCVLITLFVIVIPAALDVRLYFRNQADAAATVPRYDRRYLLPMYADEKWAPKLFAEFANLRFHFRSFVVMEAYPFQGETITIDRLSVRLNGRAAGSPRQARVWVFGGSAIWGDGVPDGMTIPAYLEQATGWRTANYGQLGYTAHQGLNWLMNEYVEGGRPEYVIFYDGYNEVAVQCRDDLGIRSTQNETRIRDLLSRNDVDVPRTLGVIGPSLAFLRNFAGDQPAPDYDCDKNEEKATMVAKALVQDWLTAKFIVESNGGKFLPVLQPSAFVGSPNTGYLESVRTKENQRRQHAAVYPKFRAELAKAGLAYLDLTGVFDGDAMIFIDQAHVIPRGNEMVAAKLRDALR